MRAGDGVHLTDAGGDRLSAPVFDLLDQRCDVTAHAIEGSPKTVLQAEDSDGPGGGSGGSGTSTRSSGGTGATAPPTVETRPPATAPPDTTPDTTTDTTPDEPPEPPGDPPEEPTLPT